jgi:hypothetical protein
LGSSNISAPSGYLLGWSALLGGDFNRHEEFSMSIALAAERLTAMTDPEQTISERFQALDSTRQEYGFSINDVSRRAGYPSKSNSTWYNLRDGKSPESTMAAFERALDSLIHEEPEETQSQQVVESRPDDLVTIEAAEGDFRIIVRGPVADGDELVRFAKELLRNHRQGPSHERE